MMCDCKGSLRDCQFFGAVENAICKILKNVVTNLIVFEQSLSVFSTVRQCVH